MLEAETVNEWVYVVPEGKEANPRSYGYDPVLPEVDSTVEILTDSGSQKAKFVMSEGWGEFEIPEGSLAPAMVTAWRYIA